MVTKKGDVECYVFCALIRVYIISEKWQFKHGHQSLNRECDNNNSIVTILLE